MKKIFKIIILIVFIVALFLIPKSQASAQTATIYINYFWSEGCPHCAKASPFLDQMQKKYPQIDLKKFEISKNKNNQKLLSDLIKKYNLKAATTPITFIGEEAIIGYISDETTGVQIENIIREHLEQGCINAVEAVGRPSDPGREQYVKIPFIGNVNVAKFSLPALTVIMGLLDGFNPCSMWALITLLSLLIITGSKRKIWLVGGIFIGFSYVSYYLFMAAWLNTFMLIGYLTFTRYIIGLLALFAGIWYFRDYLRERAIACGAAPSKTKSKLIARMEKISQSKKLAAIIIGVAAIAFTVNLIELMCTIGLPAIFTKVLTLSQMATWKYYLYIAAYDFFYMLDDVILLVIVATTLSLARFSGRFNRVAKLVGAILIFVLGLILIIKPDLLAFK